MTVDIAEGAPPPPSPPTGPSTRADDDRALEAFVGRRVSWLQTEYLKNSPLAVSELARLRRAVSSAPGADPAVWGSTLDGLPDALVGRREEPSAAEWAVHAAITLFAVHQQSQRGSGMHRQGEPLGRALRLLGRRTSNEDAVRRRFHALGAATSRPGTLHHLRGLVTQLRAEGLPLDYGRLARDLRRLQDPRWADGVRLAWGREYHRRSATDNDETAPPDPPTAPTAMPDPDPDPDPGDQ